MTEEQIKEYLRRQAAGWGLDPEGRWFDPVQEREYIRLTGQSPARTEEEYDAAVARARAWRAPGASSAKSPAIAAQTGDKMAENEVDKVKAFKPEYTLEQATKDVIAANKASRDLDRRLYAEQAEADRARHDKWVADQGALREREFARQQQALQAIDDRFAGRGGYYDSVHDAVAAQGRAAAEEWKEDQDRADRFSVAGRGLLGGSADVETQKRTGEKFDDAMRKVRLTAQNARRGAESADRKLRNQMRGDVIATRGRYQDPLVLPQYELPDYQGIRRQAFDDTMDTLRVGGVV